MPEAWSGECAPHGCNGDAPLIWPSKDPPVATCSPSHCHGLSPKPQTSHLEDHQPPVGVSMHSVGDVGTGMTSGGSPWQILHGFSLLYLWWRLEWSHQGRNHDSLQTQCAFESPTTKENKRGASGMSRPLHCPPPAGSGMPTTGYLVHCCPRVCPIEFQPPPPAVTPTQATIHDLAVVGQASLSDSDS